MAQRKMHLLIPNSITSLCGGYTRQFNPENDPHFTLEIEAVDCKHCKEMYRYNKHWYNQIVKDARIKRIVREVVLKMLEEFNYEVVIMQLARRELAEMLVARNKLGN